MKKESSPTTPRAPRCRGLLGLLFGHKYLKNTLDAYYNCDACWRCGWMRGWTVVRKENPQ